MQTTSSSSFREICGTIARLHPDMRVEDAFKLALQVEWQRWLQVPLTLGNTVAFARDCRTVMEHLPHAHVSAIKALRVELTQLMDNCGYDDADREEIRSLTRCRDAIYILREELT